MTPLQTALSEDRLTWGAWTRTVDGRELLCLLSAMSPEVASAMKSGACPANVAPLWLAHLLPWMDDAVSDAYRPEVWRRVADLQARWVDRWPEGWPADVSRRVDLQARRIAVIEARSYTTNAPALAAVDAVGVYLPAHKLLIAQVARVVGLLGHAPAVRKDLLELDADGARVGL